MSLRYRSRAEIAQPSRRSPVQWISAAVALGSLVGSMCAAEMPVTNSAPVTHTSLRAATDAAAMDQSLVLIVFSASWCGPCKLLKSKTLSTREFAAGAGALHMVDLDVDAETTAARDYQVQAVPTLVLTTSDSKIIARREGFVETAELLVWLRDGRQRAKEGKWEGTAPGHKLDPFTAKAAADQLDPNDFLKLAELLGEPDPADRAAAAKILAAAGEPGMVQLIQALTNSYLAVRIAAFESLHTLAPDYELPDPWQAPAALAPAVQDVQKWWAEKGKSAALNSPHTPDSSTTLKSFESILDLLRGPDPAQRTRAMSTLVASGAAALPCVRQALALSEKDNDHRTLGLLEDVRWAILVPDNIEQRAGSVRNTLARGKTMERQAAAARLGQLGNSAVPALAELVQDHDSLVAESAVRALAGIGGKETIPAMAALLKAADSNLRMTAAQALGHSKAKAAEAELFPVLDDPNEVVACAALSALQEIHGERDYSGSRQSQSPELVAGIKRCLTDARWRVRAAAAETAGKIGVTELADELKKLLDDKDGFVVKTSLEALRGLGASPEPEKLQSLAQQHPDLRSDTIELLVSGNSAARSNIVNALYQSSTTEGRTEILHKLAELDPRQTDNSWEFLLTKAAVEPEPGLRLAMAEALGAQPPQLTARLVGRLLTDDDERVRGAGAGLVLSLVSGERQPTTGHHGRSFSYNFMFEAGFEQNRRKPTTNDPPVTAARLADWHAALQKHPARASDLLSAAALFVTGPTNTGTEALKKAFVSCDNTNLQELAQSTALAALIPRLPWPEAQPVFEQLCQSPSLFLTTVALAGRAPARARDFLLDPQRFRTAVEHAGGKDLDFGLERLLTAGQKDWTLLSDDPKTVPVLRSLLECTNAAWRAAALYAFSLREDPRRQSYFEAALADSNSWVRATAVTALGDVVKDRAVLEKLLAPLLADADQKVGQRAAIALLEPETRSAAELEGHGFEIGQIHIWASTGSDRQEQRPLTPLETKPAFLEPVRAALKKQIAEEQQIAALLLAQYGDFSGLDLVLQNQTGVGDGPEGHSLVLTAISLARDPKYLPYLKKLLVSAKQDQDLRRLLQALRGMNGAEVRQMRLEINKRMRDGAGSG
jgi:thioredoxin 1